MLKAIKLKKLFGRFNYDIELKDEGITIITGPNGYGKSTVLTILDEFCNKSLGDVLQHTFESISFIADNDSITITKLKEHFKINDTKFRYPRDTDRVRRFGFPPYLRRIDENGFIDVRTNEHIVIEDPRTLRDFYPYNLEDDYWSAIIFDERVNLKNKSERRDEIEKASFIIKTLKQDIGQVRFIKEQRLIEKRITSSEERRSYSSSKIEYVTVISENAGKLKKEIEKAMGMHSALANQLDSSYITRLFETKEKMDKDSFETNLRDLQQKQEKLKHYGLAEIKNTSKLRYMPEFAKDLFVYFCDAIEKYKVFESLISKLDLYERIVNSKLSFKKMILSREDGISVVTDEKQNLELTSLSSGEQEILVLYYKLIFESDVNLLLIDEPEISLHVAWQKEILDDFKQIVALNKSVQVIISTHSPQIISGNWDVQIDLGEQYNG